jgi:DMSO/TMAO reductase YedYZ molybdopterin-dependent catalytic subunit
MPVWNEAQRGVWRLEVGGTVRNPLSLTLDDLMKMRSTTQKVDHFCVEGWTARAEWTGVRMSELARAADVMPDAQYVDFQSFDSDYHESWDIDSVLHPQTLIAYGMDRALLGPGHGAPARVHSPVKLGYKNTKYLTRILFPHARVVTGVIAATSGTAACDCLISFHDVTAPLLLPRNARHSSHRATHVPARAVAPTRAALRVRVLRPHRKRREAAGAAAQQTVADSRFHR